MNKNNVKGFTLIEVVASMTILVMALTMALAGYIVLLKQGNQADVQHELDINVQSAIERLKNDLRLSSLREIVGYPEVPPYTAISFPVAHIDPTTKRLKRDDSTNSIIWDETIIYHIRKGSPDELVRTTFSNRNNTISIEDRLTQLVNTVTSGHGVPESGETTSSFVIFSNLLKWGLHPKEGLFSGYAATPRRETISLGYFMLEADENELTFTVHGTTGSGYKIGIDQISASPSYLYREAELQSWSDSPAPSVSPKSSYGNRSELLFDADDGDSFTITLNNDEWELTDFKNNTIYSRKDQTVVDTDHDLETIVLKLDGRETAWEATTQTYDETGFISATNLNGATVMVMLKGSSLFNGDAIQSIGQRSCLTFRAAPDYPLTIENIWFGESSESNTAVMAYSTSTEVTFGGNHTVTIQKDESDTSDWIDTPIEWDKNYIVTYDIVAATELKIWSDNKAFSAGSDRTTQIHQPATGTTTKEYLIPALESVSSSYVDQGTYTSDIIDTHLDDPMLQRLRWNFIPNNGKLAFKVRSGNNPDLSDADDFEIIGSILVVNSSSSKPLTGAGRYIQLQALLESDTSNLKTPLLKNVAIEWASEPSMVNIVGKFSKGPDFGNFELRVNDQPVKSALTVNLEIYKETQTLNHQTRKISSSIKAEITPRNSGL